MNFLKLPLWDFLKGFDDYPQYFDTGTYWLYLFLSVLFLLLAVLTIWFIYHLIYKHIDQKRSTKEAISGELIDKRYVGEQSSSGTGTVVMPNSNGGIGVGVVSTSSHSAEEFLFFVKADQIYKMQVDMQQFYGKAIGDKVRFELIIGGLSKDTLDIELIS